jgi:hypothetical protein
LACRVAERRAGEDAGYDASKGRTHVPLDAAVVANKAYRTPLGTLVSNPFVRQLEKPNLGVLLAISAGALL